MRLKLPDITLVMIETREHLLARMAIEECLAKADFGEVLILTDRPLEFSSLTHLCEPRIITVPDWPNKLGWSQSLWFDVPPLLETPFYLSIQWDSWIWNPEMWSDDFLKYDYIGAPWWYKTGFNVGNGGFSLRSTRLGRYIAANATKYPCTVDVDDDLLCRTYRPRLELRGFRWAPEKLAHDFAFECNRPSETSQHFGFHAAFNFGVVLEQEDLIKRAEIMFSSEYIRTSYIGKCFAEKYPDVIDQISTIRNAGVVINPSERN